MSANAISFVGTPERFDWCVGRCGDVAVGGKYCQSCAHQAARLEAAWKASQPREDVGVVTYERDVCDVPLPLSTRVVFVVGLVGTAGVSGLLLFGAVQLGRMAIRWLCLHPW